MKNQTDYSKLVKALRCKRDDCEGCDLAFFDKDEGWMCQYAAKDDDAADAIEEMAKHITEMHERVTVLQIDRGHLETEVKELRRLNNENLLPKLGEWQKAKPKGVVTYSDGYAECSHCHETIWLGWGMNFCPHCGTQNRIIDPDDYDGAKMEVQDAK